MKQKIALVVALFATASSYAADSGMSVGTGTAKFNGIFQAWATNDNTSSSVTHFNMKVRRAEMKLSGSVLEDTRWFVMMDPAKTLVATGDNKILQDLGIAHSFFMPELEFTVGQFKAPNVAESLDSTAELPLAERSIGARMFGEKRSPGAMLTYKTMMYKAAVMIDNGQGNNQADNNNRKDLDMRLDLMPTDEIKAGAFASLQNYSTKGATYGVNAGYHMNDFGISAEGMKNVTNSTHSYAYQATGTYVYNKNWMPVLRYESYNVSRGGIHAYAYTAGLNYMFLKHNSKVTATFSKMHNLLGNTGTSSVRDYTKGNQMLLAFQASI